MKQRAHDLPAEAEEENDNDDEMGANNNVKNTPVMGANAVANAIQRKFMVKGGGIHVIKVIGDDGTAIQGKLPTVNSARNNSSTPNGGIPALSSAAELSSFPLNNIPRSPIANGPLEGTTNVNKTGLANGLIQFLMPPILFNLPILQFSFSRIANWHISFRN